MEAVTAEEATIATNITGLHNRHTGEAAAVIGNGLSRHAVNLTAVQRDCVLIGCNAIVRDHLPDYVIAGDPPPQFEWMKLKREGPVYINAGCSNVADFVGKSPVIRWRPFVRKGNFTGITAVCLAAYLGCNPIYLIGFDNDASNVYAGTEGYPKAYRTEDLHSQRMHGCIAQFGARYDTHPRIVQVGPHGFKWAERIDAPEEWRA